MLLGYLLDRIYALCSMCCILCSVFYPLHDISFALNTRVQYRWNRLMTVGVGVGESAGVMGGGPSSGDGQRVCGRLTNGLHAARQGLGPEIASAPGLVSGQVPVHDDHHHRAATTVSQSLRYLKEAFSALCKLGAGGWVLPFTTILCYHAVLPN